MNSSLTRCACRLVLALLLCAPGVSLAKVNVAQVDGPNEAVSCPSPAGPFADIPGLTVDLKTHGRPVFVTFTIQAILSPASGIDLRPVIDGLPPDRPLPVTVKHYIGIQPEGELTTLSFSRVYALEAGTHKLGVQFSCQGGVEVAIRWLTVYELK